MTKENPFEKGSQNSRILEALKRAPRTNRFFVNHIGAFKYSGRISEIRAKGFNIKAEQLKDGLWKYRLV